MIESLSTGISLSSLAVKFSNELSNEATGDGEVALRGREKCGRGKINYEFLKLAFFQEFWDF